MIVLVMRAGVMASSREWSADCFRWNAVYDESRTYGVDRGKNLI